jgi:glycosyltransferase involved in cell wall biosynthesis
MLMSAIKLSICIPTYDRARFLEQTLERLASWTLPFPHEIVVSDNASTDNTTAVVERLLAQGLPIRYFRGDYNTGYLANLGSALRLGRGEHLVNLSDDDRLIPEGLVEAVSFLDANPNVVACYAPWLIHDEINEQDIGQFYTVDVDFVLPQRDIGAALAFISERIAFPETGVYRASALRVSWTPRHFAFWAFSHFAHYLDQGDVAFLRNPFYRYIFNYHRIDHGANHAGIVETMTAWDRYRGGLEYLLYFGVKRGAIAGTHETLRYYDDMIQKVMVDRMVMAQKLWVLRNDFLNAYELYARLVLAGSENHPDLLALRDKIRPWAGAQTLAWFVNNTAGIRRLVIANFGNAEQLSESLRKLGLRREITIDIHRAPSPAPPQPHTVALVRLPADREPFLAMGYEPNLVLCGKDLVDTLLV